MKSRWKWFVYILCLMGCHSQPPSKPPHTLRMNISREPATLDPRKGSELIGSSMQYLLYEGLVRLNPDGTVTPAQARSIEISDDRLTYTFHLRKARWSDGSYVTAQDFEWAWKKIISPQFGAANAPLLYPIKNGEKVKKGELPIDALGIYSKDDFTFVVQLERPTPYFLDLISFCVFFPVHHQMDQDYPNWMHDASPHFISNGPFQLKSWTHHRELIFEKNNHYWEAPYIHLDQITVSMIGDENTALTLYENGELDIIGRGLSPLPTDALIHYFKQGLLKTESTPGTTIVCFNVNRFPFNNPHIRKAFAYSINRSQIVQNITQLGEEAATRLIHPILSSLEPSALFQDFDLPRAKHHLKKGLEELGITLNQFPSLTLDYTYSEVNHKLVQVLQEQWMSGLGVRVNLQSCEHQVLLDRLKNRSYDLAHAFWMAQYNDPMNIFERFKFKTNAKNYPGWEHPDYIRLLDESAYDKTPQKRAETLKAAEALLLEEMPLTPIYHWKTSFMIKDHLTCPEGSPKGAFDYARIRIKE